MKAVEHNVLDPRCDSRVVGERESEFATCLPCLDRRTGRKPMPAYVRAAWDARSARRSSRVSPNQPDDERSSE